MTTNDYICGTCKHDYTINCFKYKRDGYKNWKNKQDTCDGWTDPAVVELTEEEKADIVGDKEAHRRMVEE